MSIFSSRTAGSGAALLVAVALMLVGDRPAFSEKPAENGKAMCRADVEKFCGGMERGDGRIMQCLQENRADVSTNCRKHLEQREKRYEAFKSSCGDDAQKFCGNARGKEMRACMKKNQSNLSTSCKEFLHKTKNQKNKGKDDNKKRKGQRQERAKACRADARKLCKGVKPGDGKLLAFLREKKSELSTACAQAISKGDGPK